MATSAPSYQSFQSFNPPRSMPSVCTQPTQPRPLYFISRNTGIMVPLVPADELPFNVRLQGIPRVLRLEDTLGMQHVGMAPYTGMTFKLERDIHTSLPETPDMQRPISHPTTGSYTGHLRSQSGTSMKYLAPDILAKQALQQSASNTVVHASNSTASQRPVSAHETAANWRSTFNPTATPTSAPTFTPTQTVPTIQPTTSGPTTDKTQCLIDAILATTSGAAEASRLNYVSKTSLPAPSSGQLPDQDKKEFCTYWIRTGECDYTQQGCLYKHEMPDKATLEKIGFRTVPRWWAERQARVGLGLGVVSGVGGAEQKVLKTVGPKVKIAEWLKKGREEVKSESESGSEISDAGSESGEEVETSKEREAHVENKAGQKIVESISPRGKQDMQEVAKKEVIADVAKAIDSSSTTQQKTEQHSPPSTIDLRKASTISDLIDFAIPLLPTPAPSTPSLSLASSTPSLTPASFTNSSPRQCPSTPSTPPTPITPTFSSPTTPGKEPSTARIFVPKGESPDPHIAETRKRQAKQSARRGASVSKVDATVVVPLEKQIQQMQKEQLEKLGWEVKRGGEKSKRTPTTKTSDTTSSTTTNPANAKKENEIEKSKPQGLLASRHAPKPSLAETAAAFAECHGREDKKTTTEKGSSSKRDVNGCRYRRPTGSAKLTGREAAVRILQKWERV